MKDASKMIFQSIALCLMWFTRFPIPWRMSDTDRIQQQSLAWLPGIGILVGSLVIGILRITNQWSLWISALLALAFVLWFTGALHEDGWSDGWDAMGAGGDKDRTLSVLKDPRLGTFGTTSLFLTLGFQYASIILLARANLLSYFILAHAASRFPMAIMAWTIPYVRQGKDGKSGFLHRKPETWAWGVLSLWIVVLLYFGMNQTLHWWMVVVISMMVSFIAVIPWVRKLGGVTGDIFGFCQQAGLLAGLCAATWGIS